MNTIISSEIEITDPTKEVTKWCEDNLVYKNPEYYKKLRLGFWLGSTPKNIYNYSSNRGKLILPFGTLKRIWNLIKKEPYKVEFKAKNIYPISRIKLYDYQEKAVEKLLQAKNGILISKAGSGKGHPLNTLLYTPKGPIKLGDLKVGDKLIGSNGKAISVTNIFDRGKLDTYRVTFTDNTSIECDGEHLFTYQTRYERDNHLNQWHTENVLWFKDRINQKSRRYYIPIVKPVQFDSQEVELDPWLLGFLLGDGGMSQNSVNFTNSEKDLIEKVESLLKDNEYIKKVIGNKYGYRISSATWKEKTHVQKALEKYKLMGKLSYNKYIPNEYKYNSINTRLKVLQGLIDSDGSVSDKKEVTITTTSIQLAKDIMEITQSLGGTAKMSKRHTRYTYNGVKKEGRESYRVYIKLYEFVPFSSQKHLSKYKPREKYTRPYRIIKNIEYVGKKEIRCISVDASDKLYVAENFIVTHNTVMLLELICRLGYKALWINGKIDLMNQAYNCAKANIDNITFGKITEGKVDIGDITFATVQTLSRIDLDKYKDEWAVIVTDECQNICSTPSKTMQYSKVLSHLAARFKYGCTATFHRSDGLEKTISDIIGDIIYEVPETEIESKIMKAKIKTISTEYEISDFIKNADGTLKSFTDLIEDLSFNTDRNELILKYLRENLNHHCIVLSDRVKHLKHLQEKLGEGIVIDGTMVSKKNKLLRQQYIEDMRTGKERVLFATYSLAKEGLNIPVLDRLFLVTPKKDLTVVIQSVGRVERALEGKEQPIVYDFVDENEPMLKRMFTSRKRIYKKNSNEIE